MKRIAVLTSGGDAPGMNAALRAVVRYGIYYDMEVYAVHRGYEGLIDNEFERMSRRSVADIMHRGGTIIKTARSERFLLKENREIAIKNLQKLKIEALIVIGGNGSLAGANLLSEEFNFPVIGLPGTIDNDLGYTDYTIGFDTAVNTVLDAISKIRDTSSSHERSTVIEVMGRHCGDIALHAAYTGGGEIVLVPEMDTTVDDVCRKVNEGIESGKLHSIVLRAEGYPVSSQELIRRLKEETGQDVKLVVLSYLQRGGSPTYRDRILATECGIRAVELLKEGIYNRAIGEVGGKIVHLDLAKALKSKRSLREDLLEGLRVLSM
ncbi:MAG: 6-phosphofructokinase [Mogibacterium sp.]|nr:6-phosphofructokinase [Mogibacterium sp.]